MAQILAFQPLSTLAKMRWLRAVMARTDAPPAAKLVAWALAEHHNRHTGQCYPSAERLAAFTGLTVRGVQKALSWLRAASVVLVFDRGRRGSRRAANGYILQASLTPSDIRGEAVATPNAGAVHPEPLCGVDPEQSSQEPLTEPLKEPARVARDAESAATAHASGAASVGSIWGQAVQALQAVKGATWVRAWLAGVRPVGLHDGRLALAAPSPMVRDYLAGNMGPELRRVVAGVVPGGLRHVSVEVAAMAA